MKAKTHKFFKVKFDFTPAIILEFKQPITVKEAKQRCINFYEHTDGFCVSIKPHFVIEHLQIGLKMWQVQVKENSFVNKKLFRMINPISH
jgi:hypothetical protein